MGELCSLQAGLHIPTFDTSDDNEIACLSGGTAREELYLDPLDWASLSLLTETHHVITYFWPREKEGSYSAP